MRPLKEGNSFTGQLPKEAPLHLLLCDRKTQMLQLLLEQCDVVTFHAKG